MASIQQRQGKRGTAYAIRFYYRGARRRVSLDSNYTHSDAQAAANAIDGFLRAEQLGEPLDRKTRIYFETAPADLIRRFSALGFSVARANQTVHDCWTEFLRSEENRVKDSTTLHRVTVYNRFRAFFGTKRIRGGKSVSTCSPRADRQSVKRLPSSVRMDGPHFGFVSVSELANALLSLAPCRSPAARAAGAHATVGRPGRQKAASPLDEDGTVRRESRRPDRADRADTLRRARTPAGAHAEVRALPHLRKSQKRIRFGLSTDPL